MRDPDEPPGTTVTEPGPSTPPVDRDAPTVRDPDEPPGTTVTEPGPDAATPADDRDAPTVRDPDEPPLAADSLPDTEPPLIDDALPARAADAADVPPAPVNDANPARGPPSLQRLYTPIDRAKLDGGFDDSPDYQFGRPIFDPAQIPEGSAFSGTAIDIPTGGNSIRRIPGETMTAPDGTPVALGPYIARGGTATVFASKTDPSQVVRLVEFTDPSAVTLDAVGRKVGEAIQNPDGIGNFRLTRTFQQFLATDLATGNKWLVTVEENLAHSGGGVTNARDRFSQRQPNEAEELTMALAMREMSRNGVIWSDHKPANFDIVPNPLAPTGYQMVIFDTGGIRPVTGASVETRAATALEIQRIFDQSPRKGTFEYPLFESNLHFVRAHLDDRVFGIDIEVNPSLTLGQLYRKDRYFDLSSMSDDALLGYARSVFGSEVDLLPKLKRPGFAGDLQPD